MKIYRDGYRLIVGPDEQGCLSMTDGYASTPSLQQAELVLRELKKKTPEELAKMEQVYWTDERFETACDNGKFGDDWE